MAAIIWSIITENESGLSPKLFAAILFYLFLLQNSIKTQIMWRWWHPRWQLTLCLRWIKVWNIVPRTIYASTVLTSTPTGMLAFHSIRRGTECALLKQTQRRLDRCLFFLKFFQSKTHCFVYCRIFLSNASHVQDQIDEMPLYFSFTYPCLKYIKGVWHKLVNAYRFFFSWEWYEKMRLRLECGCLCLV